MSEPTELDQGKIAYFQAVNGYAADCRRELNASPVFTQFPEMPKLEDFTITQEMRDYKAHVLEEIKQEDAAAGMTVRR